MLSCRTIPAIGSASVIPNPFSSQILTNEVANSLCGAPRAFPGASHPGDAPAKFRTALAVRTFRPPYPLSSGCAAQTTCCSGLNGRRSERASADRLWSRCGLRAERPLVFAWREHRIDAAGAACDPFGAPLDAPPPKLRCRFAWAPPLAACGG